MTTPECHRGLTTAEAVRLLVALKLTKLGSPGAYVACLLVWGPIRGHRHWRRR